MASPTVRRLLVGGAACAAVALAVLIWTRVGAERRLEEVGYFGQAQSTLEEFRGKPLVVGNWDGRLRPYLYDGGFRPLVDERTVRTGVELEELDLINPVPFSDREVLLGGTFSGRPDFDLLLYDAAAGALHNLTNTPDVDEGGTCAHPGARLVSFVSSDRQVFATVDAGPMGGRARLIRRPTAGDIPALARCTFVDARTLLGVHLRERSLYRCTVGERVTCERTPALDRAAHVGGFYRDRRTGGRGIIVLPRDGRFRRPYRFSEDFRSVTAEPEAAEVEGDVLDFDGALLRRGLHARYRLSGREDAASEVFKAREIGSRLFAIVATARVPRTLAVWEGGVWRLLSHRPQGGGGVFHAPLEVWLRSDDGRVHQAFYFGPAKSKKVVLWWHGGPRENVSPRFNPYFQALAERGYGVLAVNYPGSTGRGREYEELIGTDNGAVRACVRAALRYLRENGIEEVLSWSVSSGVVAQRHVAAEARGLRAVVDQVGVSAEELQHVVERRGIPYFGIRGEFDRLASSEGARFVYRGGHDVTTAAQFADLLSSLDSFLASAPPARFGEAAEPGTTPQIVLDPGHVGNPGDPNRVGGITEAELTFGLARHVADRCLGGVDVLLTRAGNPMLEDPAASLRRRRRVVGETAGVPFLSLHFNADGPGADYANSSSVFFGVGAAPHNRSFSRALVAALRSAGVPPQERYGPELASKLVRVEPGIFERGLALLGPPHLSPRALLEVAYYDDPAEHRRLARVALAGEGEPVRPRLVELADALCPALEGFRSGSSAAR